MTNHNEPIFIAEGSDAPRSELPFVERDAITAILRDPKTGKYLGLRWHEVNWETFVTGGIEDGQTAEEAARAEILEETGYKNPTLVSILPKYHAQFFHHPKGVNRFAHFQSFLFDLIDYDRTEISEEEKKKHDCIWLDREELNDFALPDGHRFLMEYIG